MDVSLVVLNNLAKIIRSHHQDMFRGINHITMDAKGRFALPSRLRERLQQVCEGGIFVTRHSRQPCLVIYPMSLWEQFEQNMLAMDRRDPSVMAALRMLTAYGQEAELDDSGRIVVSPALRKAVGLSKALTLVGAIDRIELWDEQAFTEDAERQFALLNQEDDVNDAILHLGV